MAGDYRSVQGGAVMRTARYFLVNGAFAAALYFGFFGGVDGARNVAQFVAWFLFVASLGMLSDEAAKAAAAKRLSVPIWFDITFDVVVCGIFAWFGWWWTAGAYAAHSTLMHGRRESGREMLAKDAQAAQQA